MPVEKAPQLPYGAYIRHYREVAGFSQMQLAELMHVSQTRLSRWERGVSLPDASEIVRLVRYLDAPKLAHLELFAFDACYSRAS